MIINLINSTTHPQEPEDVVKRCVLEKALNSLLLLMNSEPEGSIMWERMSQKGASSSPPPRFFHAAAFDPSTSTLYVHGGDIGKPNRDYCVNEGDFHSDLWALDTTTDTWHEVPYEPQFSAANHAAVCRDGMLYIYGGKMPESVDNCTFHVINPAIGSCQPVVTNCTPPARYGHTALLHNDRLCTFGGSLEQGVEDPETNERKIETSETWLFNFGTNTWVASTATLLPTPRFHHMAWIHRDEMYVYGGQCDGFGHDGYLADLWSYSFDEDAWHMVPTDGVVPGSRAESQAIIFGEKSVYIFGGYAETEIASSQYFDDGARLIYHKNPAPSWHATNPISSNPVPGLVPR